MTYPIGGAPAPNVRQPLRVELFFLTHSETGEPLAHTAALAVALAGAVLIDDLLRPVERIRLIGDHAIVVNPGLSGDPVADWAIRELAGTRPGAGLERQRSMGVRAAIRTLAVHAYERTAAGLYAGGLVHDVTTRRLSRARRRYPPTDPADIARVRGRLCSVLTGHTHPDPHTAALAGLIQALGLVSELYLDGSRLDVRGLLGRLTALVEAGNPAAHQVLAVTDDLIAETAVAVYG
jgi:hypothetical protein